MFTFSDNTNEKVAKASYYKKSQLARMNKASLYELFRVSHKRISKSLAKYLFNYVIDNNAGAELLSHHTNKYINSYDTNQTILFSL